MTFSIKQMIAIVSKSFHQKQMKQVLLSHSNSTITILY